MKKHFFLHFSYFKGIIWTPMLFKKNIGNWACTKDCHTHFHHPLIEKIIPCSQKACVHTAQLCDVIHSTGFAVQYWGITLMQDDNDMISGAYQYFPFIVKFGRFQWCTDQSQLSLEHTSKLQSHKHISHDFALKFSVLTCKSLFSWNTRILCHIYFMVFWVSIQFAFQIKVVGISKLQRKRDHCA